MSILIPFLFGSLATGVTLYLIFRIKVGSLHTLANQILHATENEATKKKAALDIQLKEQEFSFQRKLDQLLQEHKKKLSKEESELVSRQQAVEAHLHSLQKKNSDIEKKERALESSKELLEELKQQTLSEKDLWLSKIESLSQLTTQEAKQLLLDTLEKQVQQEAAQMLLKKQKESEEAAETHALKVVTTAIQRISLSSLSETNMMTVFLPNDEMKGRIIGREGRNIRLLEELTGVTFLLDDTPNAVVLSGFDPLRKHIAKTALTELIHDGRIHPTRIEEVVKKTEQQVQKKIRDYGEHAAISVGAMNLHSELLHLLGLLHFRLSLGQNVLDHSLEVSYLMGIMASELGLDAALAKRIGLLHDIGKALSHTHEGSHAILGYEMALKYGEKEEVANGIGCHHEEMTPQTLEACLCAPADALSASRLGARNESLDQHIKRLRKLETLSSQLPGVEKAYALASGREVRVFVASDALDDHQTLLLARDLAKKIEKEMSYSGKIKVTVIREKKVIEYAS